MHYGLSIVGQRKTGYHVKQTTDRAGENGKTPWEIRDERDKCLTFPT